MARPSAPGVQATLALLLESFVTVMLKGAAGSAVDGDLKVSAPNFSAPNFSVQKEYTRREQKV